MNGLGTESIVMRWHVGRTIFLIASIRKEKERVVADSLCTGRRCIYLKECVESCVNKGRPREKSDIPKN